MKKSILVIIAIVLLSGVCFAEKDRSQWENLQGLKKGQKIQVTDSVAIVREGKFKEVSQDQIIIEVKKNTIVIPRIDVSRVVLKKSRTANVLMGLGAGAAIGLVALSTSSGSDDIYGAIVAFPILAGGGAGAGALMPASSVIYYRKF